MTQQDCPPEDNADNNVTEENPEAQDVSDTNDSAEPSDNGETTVPEETDANNTGVIPTMATARLIRQSQRTPPAIVQLKRTLAKISQAVLWIPQCRHRGEALPIGIYYCV